MTNRVFTWIAISFLLGIIASAYHNMWIYGICILWLSGLGVLFFRCFGRRKGLKRKDKGQSGCRGQSQPNGQFGQSGLLHVGIRLLVCLLFMLLGFFRQEQQQADILAVEEYLSSHTTASVTGVIYKKEEKNENNVFYLKDSYIKCENGSLQADRILIYSNADDYSIGDIILVKGSCESFDEARNEGNFDARQYYYSKNILFFMTDVDMKLLEKVKIPWKERLYRLRKEVQQVYCEAMSLKEAGVLSLMTLGDKEIMDEEVKKLYQQSGISHVTAISGLHITMIGMGLYRFLRKRRISYLNSGVAAGALIICFGQMSGMELSAVRAVTMFLLMLLGNVKGMAYDSISALSFAGMMQLWENPICLWNAGFQFSYGAVLAVVVAARILQGDSNAEATEILQGGSNAEVAEQKKAGKSTEHERDKKGVRSRLIKWKKEMGSTFYISSCIQLVTLPLTVYYYYEFPVYTVLINGLLLPFMGIVLLSGIVGGVVGVLLGKCSWILSGGMFGLLLDRFSMTLLEAGKGIAWLLLRPAEWLLKWNEWVCNLAKKLPGHMWMTGKPELWMLVGYYVILVLALLVIYWKKERDRKACSVKACSVKVCSVKVCFVKVRVIRMCAMLGVLLALVVLCISPRSKGFQVCFLDVGQGDGIYIQTEEGMSFFIDGGSTSESKVGEYRILSFLKCRGVNHIDGWFVSHADEDHISGLREIWEGGYPIDCLFLAQEIAKDEKWEELCAMAESYQTKIVYLSPQDTVGTESLKITCLAPWKQESDRNAGSLVLYLEYQKQTEQQKFTGIFAGDISAAQEAELVEAYGELTVDLYKAVHHGSNGSNSEEFLEQLSPVVSVVSCSENNSYGHPGEDAVARMEATGSEIFYTMESGQVMVGYEDGRIWVREYKKMIEK